MIYLDNAATSFPKPETVYRAMDEFMRTKAGNPGRGSHSLAIAAGSVIKETRALVSQLINCRETCRVIFTSNCTESLNLGLKGFLKRGDHVVTDSVSHNSVVRPLHKLEKLGIFVNRIAPAPETGFVRPRDVEAAITGVTKLIVITHASNVNGVIQPIAEYGNIARAHNVIFMVDAAQSAGIYPIDVQADNIDMLAFSGHKGLFGPPGTGVLYVGGRVELDTIFEGGTGSYSESEKQPEALPDAFESGTPNGPGIAGLGTGLKFNFETGMDKIRGHEERLTRRLVDGLSHIKGVALYTAKDTFQQAPVVSFNLGAYLPQEVGKILDRRYDIKVRAGLQCSPQAHKSLGTFPAGTVRISPGYFNTEADIDSAIGAISQIPLNVTDEKRGVLSLLNC